MTKTIKKNTGKTKTICPVDFREGTVKLSDKIKTINTDYAHNHEDVLRDAARIAEKRETELLAEIKALRAVIAELPEYFTKVNHVCDDGDEYFEADTDNEPTCKSDLLKMHGVEE